MTPRPSLVPEPDPPPPPQPTPPPDSNTSSTTGSKGEPGKPPSRTGGCRVCLKAFKPDDFSRTCAECHQRVCEDCASYSKVAEAEEEGGVMSWTCSVCRRKLQSRAAMQQDSSESLLDVPMQAELQRRHSEARLGTTSGGLTPGGLSSGLAPPRSPELRRHSDVSPASLKELEKLKGTPGGGKNGGSGDDWGRRGGRSCASSRANSPPRSTPTVEHQRSRRGSRVARQHSYDDEVKSGSTGDMTHIGCGGGGGLGSGLGLPAPMPRRASAYDVFTVPALSTVTNLPQAPASGLSQAARRPSFRGVPTGPPPASVVAAAAAAAASAGGAGPGGCDTPTTPPSPDIGGAGVGGGLMALPDEDRRQRRRGSQL